MLSAHPRPPSREANLLGRPGQRELIRPSEIGLSAQRRPIPSLCGDSLHVSRGRPATGRVGVDEAGRTSTPNVWACGDTAATQSVTTATAGGLLVAAVVNHDLVAAGVRYAL